MGTRSAISEVKLSFQSTMKNTLDNADIASATIAGTVLSGKIEDGVSADQANRAWRTTNEAMISGAVLDIDLYDFAGFDIGAGAGKDAFGQDLILEEVVTLIIKHRSGAGRLEINPTAHAQKATWIPSLTVANGGALKVGGVFMMHQSDTDAFDIADGVSHILRLKANGGAVNFDMYVLGRNDDDESSSSSESSSSQSSTSVSSVTSLSSTRSGTSQTSLSSTRSGTSDQSSNT